MGEGDTLDLIVRDSRNLASDHMVWHAGERQVFEAVKNTNLTFEKSNDNELTAALTDAELDKAKLGSADYVYLLRRYQEVYDLASATGHAGVANYAATMLSNNLVQQLELLDEVKGRYKTELDAHDEASTLPLERARRRVLNFGLNQIQVYEKTIHQFLTKIGKPYPPPTPAAPASVTNESQEPAGPADVVPCLEGGVGNTASPGSLEYTLGGMPDKTNLPVVPTDAAAPPEAAPQAVPHEEPAAPAAAQDERQGEYYFKLSVRYYFNLSVGGKTEKAFGISDLANILGVNVSGVRANISKRQEAYDKLKREGAVASVVIERVPGINRKRTRLDVIALSYASQILSKDSAAKLAGLNVEKKFNLQEFPVDKYQVERGVDTSKGDKSTGNGTNAPPTGKHASEGLDYILNPPCFTDRKVTGTPEGTIEYVALQLGDKVVVYWPTRSAEQVLLKKEFRGMVYKTGSVAINTSGVARYVSVTDEVLEVRIWSENNKVGKYLVRADCMHKVIPNYVKGDMAPEKVFPNLSKGYEYRPMDESRIDVMGLESALKELNLMPKNTHLSLHGSEVYSFEQIAEMRVFDEHGYDVAKIATCAEKLAKRGKISLVPIDEELKDLGPKGVMRNQVMALYWALDAQK